MRATEATPWLSNMTRRLACSSPTKIEEPRPETKLHLFKRSIVKQVLKFSISYKKHQTTKQSQVLHQGSVVFLMSTVSITTGARVEKETSRLTVSAPAPTDRILLAIHPGTAGAGAGSTSNLAFSSDSLSLSIILLGRSGKATAGLPSPTASHDPSSSALSTPPRLRKPPVTTKTRLGNLLRISRAESRKKPSRAAALADAPGR